MWDVNKQTYNSNVKGDKWNIVIRDTLSLVAIKDTAAKADISVQTVFNMRHKILLVLAQLVSEHNLEGVIECDETFVLESNKGKAIPGKKARKRQALASKRGLSNEQICVIVSTNQDGVEYACAVDRGKPSSDSIKNCLINHIEENSVMITDGLASYNHIVALKVCIHYTLSSYKEYDKLLHLNTVNIIPSLLKQRISKYHGVTTKYLNRYTALLIFPRKFSNMDDNEMMQIVKRDINEATISYKTRNLASYRLVKV